jgi:hypothetical protein
MAKISLKRDRAAGPSLRDPILHRQSVTNPAAWVEHHRPVKVSDLTGSQSCFHGQEHDRAVPGQGRCVLRVGKHNL